MGTEPEPVAVGHRPRGFVRVSGPQAAEYLGRMLSNEVEALAPGEACEALLLTPKGRVVAPLVAVRRSDDDVLLLTEPELAETVRDLLGRMRFAARAEIDVESHSSHVLLGEEASPPRGALAVPTADYGVPGYEVVDADPPDGAPSVNEEALERLRILAGTPRFGREIDDRVLPAEAGLDERAISFTKGCFPGQEPVARLRYRGHVNRRLRVLAIEAAEPPAGGTEIAHGERTVGRVTSAVRDGGRVVALGYVRTDVPDDAVLVVNGATATMAPLARP